MSIRLMSLVWDIELNNTQKIILLSLADNANDDGLCWPSIATIAKRCGAGERTVQRAIKSLADNGHLTRYEVHGKGCKYYIHPRHSDTPVTKSPASLTTQTPVTVSPHPRHSDTQTINEPSIEPSIKKKQSKKAKPAKPDSFDVSAMLVPSFIPIEAWIGFVKMRIEKREPIDTERKFKLIIEKLTKFNSQGMSVENILNNSEISKWTNVYPEKGNANGQRNNNSKRAFGYAERQNINGNDNIKLVKPSEGRSFQPTTMLEQC